MEQTLQIDLRSFQYSIPCALFVSEVHSKDVLSIVCPPNRLIQEHSAGMVFSKLVKPGIHLRMIVLKGNEELGFIILKNGFLQMGRNGICTK